MRAEYRRLPELLDSYNIQVSDRSYLLPIALARFLAYKLPLPSSPVEVPLAYFASTFLGSVYDALSEINEVIVINIELAATLTKKLWLLRYNTVYDMNNVASALIIDQAIAVGSHEIPPKANELYHKYSHLGLFSNVASLLNGAYGSSSGNGAMAMPVSA